MKKERMPIIKGAQSGWSCVGRPTNKPLITIITSTFNSGKSLQWTGASIRNQTYPYIQWIIADGGSEDETLTVIEQFTDIIDFWFSEPDEGIYDAWNKALRYAKGDWVQFVGAGDELAASTTLEDISQVLVNAYPKHDLVYGNLLYISEVKRQPLECVGEPWSQMKDKWTLFRPRLPLHPAVFHHRALLSSDKPFDLRFKIAGDSHLLIKSIENKEPLYYDLLIDKMPLGGVSGKLKSSIYIVKENRQISKELGYKIPLRHQCFEFFLTFAKYFVYFLFPKKFGFFFADLFRKFCGNKSKWGVK